MRRTPSPFKPDNTLDAVVANDIGPGVLESRHFADDEIIPAKVAMVENKVALPVVIDFEVTADATGGLAIFNANAPFKMEILEVVVQARATVSNGTAKLTDGTSDITDAIVCAVDTTVTRVGTIDNAKSTVAKSGTLKVVTANAGDRGLVTIIAIKRD